VIFLDNCFKKQQNSEVQKKGNSMNQQLKLKSLLSVFAIALFAFEHDAGALVGYINIPIYTGDNLIANQLDAGANTLNDLFPTSNTSIPDGTTFKQWDPIANMYLPTSTYDSLSGWSINYNFNTFASGAGAVLNSPSAWTWTSIGNVVLYDNLLGMGGPIWNPNYASGKYLIASPIPFTGPIDTMFYNVAGRPPLIGESVQILNAATQTYTTTTFNGTSWDNGDPSLSQGEAAWFTLVPEPSSVTLIGFGVVMVALFCCKPASRIKPIVAP
jgi:hypothetical protein